MMKNEFEALAGYEVSNDDYYKIIEPMYMSTDLSKQDFIKTVSKKRFALKTKRQLVNEAKKLAKGLKETCYIYTDLEAEERMEQIRVEIQDRFGCGYVRYHQAEIAGCDYPSEMWIYDMDWNIAEKITLAA